jgi:hypothetical protein
VQICAISLHLSLALHLLHLLLMTTKFCKLRQISSALTVSLTQSPSLFPSPDLQLIENFKNFPFRKLFELSFWLFMCIYFYLLIKSVGIIYMKFFFRSRCLFLYFFEIFFFWKLALFSPHCIHLRHFGNSRLTIVTRDFRVRRFLPYSLARGGPSFYIHGNLLVIEQWFANLVM